MDSKDLKLWHVCEVCDKELLLTPEEGFDAGWDYPPRMGAFAVISPRTCGSCTVNDTLWWRLVVDKVEVSSLNDKEQRTLERILNEPVSILES